MFVNLYDQKKLFEQDKCKCTLAQKLVGDGCYICNPAYAKDHDDPIDNEDFGPSQYGSDA